MRHLPPLRSLQAFEATARLGGVARAAEELHVTPSAVSHRLRRLEEALGIKLFHRGSRTIALSDAGRDYLQTIGAAFDRIEQSTDRIRGGMTSDVLTVHCPPSFAPAWLLPRLPDFIARHPDIALRVHASPVPVDFFRNDTDVEIRYGEADWIGLVVVPLMADRVAPLCSPAFAARLPEPVTAQTLADAPLIRSERALLRWEDWLKARGATGGMGRVLSFDRGYLALQAAEMGLGVALESVVFAERSLREGRLVRLLPEAEGDVMAGAHTLVYPPVYQGVRKIEVFREWVLGEAAAAS